VGEAAQGAAGLGLEGDAAGDAEVVLDAGRPHAARLQVHAGAEEAVAGPGGGPRGDVGGPLAAGAVVPAAAGGRRRVVQPAAEDLLPAGGGRDVVEHRLLLAAAFGGDPLIAFPVVLPRHAGGRPAALDAADRAVHVEDLEHHLEAGPAEVDQRFERAGGQRAARGLQHVEGVADDRLRREREAGEVRPDLAVLPAGQQDHLGAVDAAAGAADLLVVGDRGLRRAHVDDEAEVGLVEAHAE